MATTLQDSDVILLACIDSKGTVKVPFICDCSDA